MPSKRIFTEEEIQYIREKMDEGVPKYKIAEALKTTDTMITRVCKANGIDSTSKKTYICVVCKKPFKASHVSAICPECKSTPSVCVICGKEFPRASPYTQKTCSPACRGQYRAESGIGKAGAAKMKETKLERYGTLDPAEVAKANNGGQLESKICAFCGKEFVPKTPRQIYCSDIHYGPCPVCGKPVEIKDYTIGPQACSEECRIARINATCLERYGNKDAVNSEHAKILGKQHSLERYGKEYYTQTDEFKERFKQTSLERYGAENPVQNPEVRDKIKKTNLERYGAEYYLQTEEGKEKVRKIFEEKYGGIGLASPTLKTRIQATNLEKYGDVTPLTNPEVQQKMHDNSMKKNGVYWPALAPDVVARRKATNIERYGTENPWGNEDIKKKLQATWTEKYGGPNPMYSKELREISQERQQQTMIERYGAPSSVYVPEIKDKIIATNMDKYGVPWYMLTEEFAQSNPRRISKLNRQFAADLNDLGIETSFEFRVESFLYDIKLENSPFLIELDPTFTHNSHEFPWGDPIRPDYHLNKTKTAESAGYRCIHIFDWDDTLAIQRMLVPKQLVYARKCNVMQIDRATAEQFTARYHLQRSCKGQNLVYGLYYKGELIEMMSFGKPRYAKKEKFDFELLRLCTKEGITVAGGASKLFAQFKKDYPNRSVISYCDYAKFTGSVYEQLGMDLIRTTPPAKVWSKGVRYITDNYLRQRGFDQLFGTNYGKGTSNEELMLADKWLPVYDCGQKVFAYIPAGTENS